MVAVDSCRHAVVDCGGIDVCLDLLNESPLDYKTPAEIAACERVQQKATIAVTRMCRDENNAETIVKAEGRKVNSHCAKFLRLEMYLLSI